MALVANELAPLIALIGRLLRLLYPAPWIVSTKSPAFSNLLKYNGFGHLCEGLVKIGWLGRNGTALAKASLDRLELQ
jgi:hypothetical protein